MIFTKSASFVTHHSSLTTMFFDYLSLDVPILHRVGGPSGADRICPKDGAQVGGSKHGYRLEFGGSKYGDVCRADDGSEQWQPPSGCTQDTFCRVDADAGRLAFQATDMFDQWKDDTCDDCPGGQKVKER
jgi:hypothetical protein